MTPGTAFALGAVGGALAGRAYKRGIAPMLVGGAAGSFAMVQLTKSKIPPPGAAGALPGGPPGFGAAGDAGISSGTGAVLVLIAIGAAVLYGDKTLKKLGG